MTENKYGVQALNDHVIAEVITTTEGKSEGGIIIPQTVEHKPQKYGKVVSVGPEANQNINEDDLIMFAKHGGQTIIMQDTELKVLKIGEVYCVLKKID